MTTDEDETERRLVDRIVQMLVREHEVGLVSRKTLQIAFKIGLAAPPWSLLPGGLRAAELWLSLVEAVAPLGWTADVGYLDQTMEFVLLAPGHTIADWDAMKAEWMTVETYGDGDTVIRHGFGDQGDQELMFEIPWLTHRTVEEAVARIGKPVTWDDAGCMCAVGTDGLIMMAHPKCSQHYGQEPRCNLHGGEWALFQCPLPHTLVAG
jgi:hypothetical protein